MKTISLSLLVCFCIIFTANAQFKWPDGKKAAIVFTYDDGLDCDLDVAVPQLDEFGFKGTFFVTGSSPSLYNRLSEWRKVAENGHELGNHTLFHPCSKKTNNWVKPEYNLENYSPEQIVAEMQTANTLLKAIDGKDKHTFAYTCCEFVAGSYDFTNDVKNIFSAARLIGPIPETMINFDTNKTPSSAVNSPTTDDLIALVDKARKNGTIVIFLFHSVGGGYLNVDAKIHRQLLQYVKDNEKDFYSGTFMEVMEYVKKHNTNSN